MLVEKLGNFILHSRFHTTMIAVLFTCVPFLGWCATVIIGLVTLCKNKTEGFFVLLWTALPYVIFAFMQHNWTPFLFNIMGSNLIVYLLALILRRYSQWRVVLEYAALLGIASVVATHLYVPDTSAWWQTYLTSVISDIAKDTSMSTNINAIQQSLPTIAPYFTGIVVFGLLSGVLFFLAIARAWQSRLFAPGQWQKEWCHMRLGYTAAIACITCFVLSLLNIAIFKDIIPILLLVFLFGGIGLVHGILSFYKARTAFFILFYGCVIISLRAFPLFLKALVVIAVLDSFFNFRTRIQLARLHSEENKQ